MTSWSGGLARGAGMVVLVLATFPVYRLAGGEERGLAGRATVDIVATQSSFLWSGTLVVALLALLAGLLLRRNLWTAPWRRLRALLLRPRPGSFAAGLAVIAFTATTAFTILVLERRPNLIDAMAQLLQARYMAAGRLAGPMLQNPAFWFIQNTVLTDSGWVAQYPPGHTALLALTLRLGLVEVTGALFMAIVAAFTYLSLRRLLPGDELAARLSGLGVAVSPFLISQAGSYMNHGSAAALSVLAIYFALRARDGRATWGLALGGALGLLFASRPLFALVIAFGVIAPIAVLAVRRSERSARAAAGRVALAVAGGAPFLALVLAYNAHFFGGPFEFGYVAAWGESHGLGFHRDPWGNLYTPLAALAYTSADLTALSLSLFETPLPLVALVGLWLALPRRPGRGHGVLVAWALLPVVANFFYWHHGYFMGPRMLAEAAPAWVALTVLALRGLLTALPDEQGRRVATFRPRTAGVTAMALAAFGALYLGPLRLVNRGGEFLPSMRLDVPSVEAPALVFVHGSWSGRVFGRLAGEGMAMHELETALRQNDLCRLQQLLDADAFDRSMLDLEPRPSVADLTEVELYPGNTVTLDRSRLGPRGGVVLPTTCRREVLADRHGIMDIAPLLWRGALPGAGRGAVLYARDLGPALNERLRGQYPDRLSYLAFRERPGGPLVVRPYGAGLERLWGSPPAAPFD